MCQGTDDHREAMEVEIAKLNDQIEHERRSAAADSEWCQGQADHIAVLETENAKLRVALKQFGEHANGCKYVEAGKDFHKGYRTQPADFEDCSCGLCTAIGETRK